MPITDTHTDKSSPLKSPPRRQAGQSLRQHIAQERDGYAFYSAGIALALTGSLVLLWCCWLFWRPETPWFMTGWTLLVFVGLWFEMRRRRKWARSLELGMKGEQVVAEWLTELAAMDYRVFHDLPGDGGSNIDHVAAGPAGVFVIETKTRSKKPGAQVLYDGKRLLVDGWDATNEILSQAKACRDDVRRRIESLGGQAARGVRVRAVVAFPGWDVPETISGPDVWVLNPKNRIAVWISTEERVAGAIPAETHAAAVAVLDTWARQ